MNYEVSPASTPLAGCVDDIYQIRNECPTCSGWSREKRGGAGTQKQMLHVDDQETTGSRAGAERPGGSPSLSHDAPPDYWLYSEHSFSSVW